MIALITGAARRLGREIALSLAQDGFHIAAQYGRSQAEAELLKQEVEAAGGACDIFQCDFMQPEAAGRLFDEVVREVGVPEVLINNASTFVNDDIEDFAYAHLEANMKVNLAAPLSLASCFARRAEAGRNNVVINMLDNKLERLSADFFSYTISKYALLGATEMMALRFAPKVRVVGVAPSVTLISGEQDEANFARSRRLTLMERGPELRHITSTIRFLIDNDIITGEVIAVDGGQILMNLPRDVAFLVGDGGRDGKGDSDKDGDK